MEVKTCVRLFDLSQSPSARELALFEKPERYTTASFRRLMPTASSGTRHPPAICASAQTSIAARRTYHDRDHRCALQFVFTGKSPRADRHHLGLRGLLDAVLPDRRTAARRLDESASDRAPCGMALRVR